jgi:glycosyl transferase family 87
MRSIRPGDRSKGDIDFLPLTSVTIVLVLSLALLMALVPKLLCLDQLAAGEPERHWCFSDLKALYDQRGFDVKAVPYADPPAGYPVDYVFEYPPGIGLPAYGLARLSETRLQFFWLNAVTLLLAAAFTAWALDRAILALGLPRRRLLMYIASPTLVVFALHTWDLWSVAPAAGGLAAAASGRRRLAAALFGVGAAVKWWPALLVVLLLFGPWAEVSPDPKRRGLWWRRLEPGFIAAGAWAAVQAPALFIDAGNWWASIAFQLRRAPNTDGLFGSVRWLGTELLPSSFWGGTFTSVIGVVGAVSMLAGISYIAWRLHRGSMYVGDAALALIVLLLLTSKVFSPQFVLWLLPVAVISSIRWRQLLAVELPNAGVWFALSGQLFHLGLYRPLAFLRAAALVWVLLTTLGKSPSAVHPPMRSGRASHERGRD